MAFFPKVNDQIRIGWEAYTFTEHPYAPGMPYGQTGRKGTVYQVKNSKNQNRALKVFASAFRSYQINSQASDLSRYAILPGLSACKRVVLTQNKDPELISTYPDLHYSVLMPWLTGYTWQEYVMNRWHISKHKSYKFAYRLIEVLATMERQHIAHCDLSGPNVIINRLNGSNGNARYHIALIDLEDLYAEGLRRPEKVPAGSAGYAHKQVATGIWSEHADRFSGTILIANILAWSNPNIHDLSFGEQYFDPKEMQTSCHRERVLYEVLQNDWSENVANLFSQAWYSDSLDDCPSFSDWSKALKVEIPEIEINIPEEHPQLVKPAGVGGPVTGWRSINGDEKPVIANSSAQPAESRKISDHRHHGFDEWDSLQNREKVRKVQKAEVTRPVYTNSSSGSYHKKNKKYEEDDFLMEREIIIFFVLIVLVLGTLVLIGVYS